MSMSTVFLKAAGAAQIDDMVWKIKLPFEIELFGKTWAKDKKIALSSNGVRILSLTLP